MEKKYYAHSLEGRPPEEWQPLEGHLKSNPCPMLEKGGQGFPSLSYEREAGRDFRSLEVRTGKISSTLRT